MANIKYADLIDDVLPNLAADPSDPVTEYAIKRAVIEFCAGSWVWRAFPDAISVKAGVNTYDLEPETGTDITTVLSAELNGVPLSPKDLPWLNKEIPGWRTTQKSVKYFTQIDTESIILAPVPDTTVKFGLSLVYALQPSQKSVDFPNWIYTQFIYAIADGAMSKLMLMPQKPWSDPATGLDKRAKFESAIANARQSAVSALGTAPQRTTSQH